jgi:hypothetical protein
MLIEEIKYFEIRIAGVLNYDRGIVTFILLFFYFGENYLNQIEFRH